MSPRLIISLSSEKQIIVFPDLFKEAINLGYRIIKIFPASKLGISFLNKLKEFAENNICFIGAGGIKSKDLKYLLQSGYNALTIGKELANHLPDQDLKIWLKNFKKDNYM